MCLKCNYFPFRSCAAASMWRKHRYLDYSPQPLDYCSYLINMRDILIITFTLVNNISLRRVIGLPMLLVLGGLVDFVKGYFVCSKVNCTFLLTLDLLGRRLPERCSI